jgi:hypothetical protein
MWQVDVYGYNHTLLHTYKIWAMSEHAAKRDVVKKYHLLQFIASGFVEEIQAKERAALNQNDNLTKGKYLLN